MPKKKEDTALLDETVTNRFVAFMNEVLGNRKAFDTKTLRAFCEIVGIQITAIYSLKQNKRSVTIGQCINLCNHYGLSANWLLLGIQPMFLSQIDKAQKKKLSQRLKDIANELKEQEL